MLFEQKLKLRSHTCNIGYCLVEEVVFKAALTIIIVFGSQLKHPDISHDQTVLMIYLKLKLEYC